MDHPKLYPNYLILSLLLFLIAGCSLFTGSDKKKSLTFECSLDDPILTERNIYKLKYHSGALYAGTDSGLVKIDLQKEICKALGPKRAEVRTFIIFSENHYLVSAKFPEIDSTGIAKTTDGGQHWIPMANAQTSH